MAFFDRFRKKQEQERLNKASEVKGEKLQKDLELVKKTKKDTKESVKTISKNKTTVVKKEGVKIGGAKVKSKFNIEAESILVKPLITEKISDLAAFGKYSFEVKKDANKLSVKKAVSVVYGVKVNNVRIINVQGKNVRYGKHSGRTKDWKKAIVTLAPGEKLELYEGV